MSIISKNERIKKEALRAYQKKVAEMRTVEHNAMNEMLDILRTVNGTMTAAQLEGACTSGISKHEIAGNLLAMQAKRSRYELVNCCYGYRIPRVNIPEDKFGDNKEYIAVKLGGNRKAIMVELDENSHVIPNSKRTVTIHESNLYAIEKVR